MIYNFEKLEVWGLSLEVIDQAYGLAKKLPEEERYNLRSQLVRAATSIALNIAEGSARKSRKEFVQFIRIALGSVLEVIAITKICLRRKFLQPTDVDQMAGRTEKVYFKLIALEKSMRS